MLMPPLQEIAHRSELCRGGSVPLFPNPLQSAAEGGLLVAEAQRGEEQDVIGPTAPPIRDGRDRRLSHLEEREGAASLPDRFVVVSRQKKEPGIVGSDLHGSRVELAGSAHGLEGHVKVAESD